MKEIQMYEPEGLLSLHFEDVPAVNVGPGCIRRDMPSRTGVRVWIVQMEPGAIWPRRDRHDDLGENIIVVEGELIEGEVRLGKGSYLHFGPGSSHRPRTETGVTLFGFNLQADSPQVGF